MATAQSFVVSLPTGDRRRTRDFYRHAFALEPFGPVATDGVPEPLQYRLDDRVTLMFIPADGFGWVLGRVESAPAGTSECIMSLTAPSAEAVSAIADRVRDAGGSVTCAPEERPWGFTALCTDPDGHVWQVIHEQ